MQRHSLNYRSNPHHKLSGFSIFSAPRHSVTNPDDEHLQTRCSGDPSHYYPTTFYNDHGQIFVARRRDSFKARILIFFSAE